MLNEDKIKLMNEIATFRKKEGKKTEPAEKYFKSDFIARHMIQSFLAFTLCYILLLVVSVLYHMEKILSTASVSDLAEIAKQGVVFFVAGLVIFEGITWYIYGVRYDDAVRLRKVFLIKMNRLWKRYEFQDKTRELQKEGGRNA